MAEENHEDYKSWERFIQKWCYYSIKVLFWKLLVKKHERRQRSWEWLRRGIILTFQWKRILKGLLRNVIRNTKPAESVLILNILENLTEDVYKVRGPEKAL